MTKLCTKRKVLPIAAKYRVLLKLLALYKKPDIQLYLSSDPDGKKIFVSTSALRCFFIFGLYVLPPPVASVEPCLDDKYICPTGYTALTIEGIPVLSHAWVLLFFLWYLMENHPLKHLPKAPIHINAICMLSQIQMCGYHYQFVL